MSNEQVVRDYIAAVGTGDPEAVRPYLADDVTFHIPGKHPVAGQRTGPDEVVAMFRELAERSGAPVNPQLHDLLVSDDHVVALVRRTIAGVDAPAAVVYHVEGDKLTGVWVHELDPYALDDAFAGSGG